MPDEYQILGLTEKEEAGFDEIYSVLVGPDSFECALREPEDRNWSRDGFLVVEQLNRQLAKIRDLEFDKAHLLGVCQILREEIKEQKAQLARQWEALNDNGIDMDRTDQEFDENDDEK